MCVFFRLQDGFEGFMFLTGLPTVTYAGYAVAKSRILSFNNDILLTSVHMVGVRAFPARIVSFLRLH